MDFTTTVVNYITRPASVSTAVLAVVCLIGAILARRNAWLVGLFCQSLTSVKDGEERADERKITVFAFTVVTLFGVVRGFVFNSWPPGEIFVPLLTFIGAGIGLTTWSRNVLNKAEAEKKKLDTPQEVEVVNNSTNPVPVAGTTGS